VDDGREVLKVKAQESTAEPAAGGDAATESLKGLVGEWVGTTKTWFEPETLADESAITARIRPIGLPAGGADGAGAGDDAGGFVLYEYNATLGGDAYEGVAIVGVDGNARGLVSAWVDSFHMSKAIMLSRGDAPARSGAALGVLGSYADPEGGPSWGWRTEFAMPDGADGDRLIVTAYNIAPDGTEARALESTYLRR
jgi:hypothetical protein